MSSKRREKRSLPDNVSSFIDRHGKERFRYRKGGRSVYLKEHPGTAKHPSAEVKELAAGRASIAPRAKPGTIGDLIVRYYATSGFNNAGDAHRQDTRRILERFRAKYGDRSVKTITFEVVEAILVLASRKQKEGKRTVGGKSAAHRLHELLIRLFEMAVKLGWIDKNPAELAEKVKVPKTKGFHPWSEEEIAQYQAAHAIGTKARLALEIFLWTGQRRGDASTFGRRHLKGGRVHYTQAKTGKELWLPAAPQLLEAIAAMPVTGTETFLVTDYGKPFSKAGLGNKMREWCDEAGLHHCSAHGLRKAIARRLAEMVEAGNPGIKSVGGWSNDAEVSLYTAGADQKRLADQTLGRLIELDLANRADGLAKGAPQEAGK